jgi:hypothetical protein
MAGTTGRGVARAGARGVAVGTAAIAVLGVLQQAIGAFDPRPAMSATIVAAVALASFVTKRLGDRRREDREAAELRRLLVVWPPRPLGEVDPVHLSAFPARRDLGTQLPYVPRGVDVGLRAALQPGSVVLLHGPPFSGKTRTAYEVASVALPGALVIAPRSPDALAGLLALDPPIDAGQPDRVVWLDDLARFASLLDPATLEETRSLGAPAAPRRGAPPVPPATVIATIRSADWDVLRAAGGAEGLGARAVAAVARSFELPARLTESELAAARKLYPGVAFADGIGPALSSTATDAAAPAAVAPPIRATERSDPLRDLQLAIPAGLTVAALATAALIWAVFGFSIPSPPSVSDQLANINRDAAREGRLVTRPAGVGGLDLHGTDAMSYFRLVEDRPGSGRPPRAHEVRIYDERDGRLSLRMRFEPREPGARFQFRAAADIDFDGAVEIVGGYSRPDARQALVPFAIDFDDGLYRLVPLDLGTPALTRIDLERRFRIPTRQYRPVYAKPISFADRRSPGVLTGRRVQDFIVTGPRRRLVAGYFVQAPPSASDLAVLELQAAIFKAGGGGPRVQRCVLSDGTVARASLRLDSRDEPTAMRESWESASTGRDCTLKSP